MTKKLNSNTVSYFDLKPPSKKQKSKSRSRSNSKSPKRSSTKKSQSTNKEAKRSKSLDASTKGQRSTNAATKGQRSTSQSVVKTPVRTGNLPKNKSTAKSQSSVPSGNSKDKNQKDLLDSKFRGKKILIFKNGHDANLVEEPFPTAVSEHSYPTLASFLEYLNQKLILHSGRINKLYKIQGGEITDLKQLRDKGWYVASNGLYVPPVNENAKKSAPKKFNLSGNKKKDVKNDSKSEKDGKNHLKVSKNNKNHDESESEYESEFEDDDNQRLKPNGKNKNKRDESESEYEYEDSEAKNSGKLRKTSSVPGNLDKSGKGKKPPLPKYDGKKKISHLSYSQDMDKEKENHKPNKMMKQKSELPFGRMGTLGPYIRSHRPGSLRKAMDKKTENDEIVSQPMERAMSSESTKRRKSSVKFDQFHENHEDVYEYDHKPPPRSASGSRVSFKGHNSNNPDAEFNNPESWKEEFKRENSVTNGNSKYNDDHDDVDNYRSRASRRKSVTSPADSYYKSRDARHDRNPYDEEDLNKSRDSRHDRNHDDERRNSDALSLIHEPSEMEPMNKIMYPSGYRPPSRKDAASSAKALKHDAAVSARNSRNYSADPIDRKNVRNPENFRKNNSAGYDDRYDGRKSIDYDDNYRNPQPDRRRNENVRNDRNGYYDSEREDYEDDY